MSRIPIPRRKRASTATSEPGLRLCAAAPTTGGRADKLWPAAAESVLSWALAASGLAAWCAVLGVDAGVAALALPAGVAAAGTAALRVFGRAWVAPLALVAVTVAVLLGTGGGPASGALAFWNACADALGAASAFRLPLREVAENAASSAAPLSFTCLLSAFTALVAGLLLRLRHSWWLLVPLALLGAATAFTQLAVPAVPVLLHAGACAAALVYVRARNSVSAGRSTANAVVAVACMAILAGVGLLGAQVAAPADAYQRSNAMREAQHTLDHAMNSLRYGGAGSPLAEGDLEHLGTWQGGDATALTVTMERPRAAYLRGYVGSVFGGTSWQPLSPQERYESTGLFWWLHEGGFSGNTQLAATLDALAKPATAKSAVKKRQRVGSDAQNVTVRADKASRRFLYEPYGLRSLEGAPALEDSSDENDVSAGIVGCGTYAYSAELGLETRYPDLAAQSWIVREESGYWANEAHYNEFVYQHYTQLPDATAALLSDKLGSTGSQANGHIDYRAALKKVLSWLDENASYSTDVGGYGRGTDFLAKFLEEKKGGPAHLATAATCMLRYYGIPARYVEGYLLQPDDVAGASPEGTVQVPLSRAHAWCEMYVDGCGWVPVEPTQSVRGIMPQADLGTGINADSSVAARAPQPLDVQEATQTESFTDLLKEALVSLALLLLVVLIIVDIVSLVFFVASLARRLLAMRRRRRAFAASDSAQAVRNMVGYMTQLARYRAPLLAAGDAAGCSDALTRAYGSEAADSYETALCVARKAAFSSQDVSADERASVAQCTSAVLERVKAGESAWSRWIMRYIERLM